MSRLLTFPTEHTRTSGHPVPNPEIIDGLYFGKFTAAQYESIRERFHEGDETAEKLGREFEVGTTLIQQVVRVKRKPPGNASANDRRQVKQVKVAA